MPHVGNNFRAKLLHNSTLFVITILFLLIGTFGMFFNKGDTGVLGISYSISAEELVAITNRYRAEKGLTPLSINTNLSSAASQKASDMMQKNYWAHFAPDGSTSPWFFIKNSGYSYMYAGENLAKGFTNSEEVVKAWMESPTHRDNMLSSNYKDIGFAIVSGHLQGEETVLVVEMFGSTSDTVVAANTDTIQTIPQAQAQAQAQAPVPTSVAISPIISQAPVPVVTQGEIVISPVIAVDPNQASAQSLVVAEQKTAPITPFQTLAYFASPLIDVSQWSTNIVVGVFTLLVLVLVVDVVVITRNKIPRFVGHNLDHILVIMAFLLIVLFTSGGNIL